jgi:hypothetical protein
MLWYYLGVTPVLLGVLVWRGWGRPRVQAVFPGLASSSLSSRASGPLEPNAHTHKQGLQMR